MIMPRRPRLASLALGALLALTTLTAVSDVAFAQDAEEGEAPPPAPDKPDPGATMKLVMAYALALAGLGVVGVAVAETLKNNVPYPAAKFGMVNMLRTQPNNAEIMCRTMPGTFYEAIGAAFKTAALIGPADLALYQSATRPSYDGGAIGVNTKWKTAFGKAKLGGMAAGGGLALVASGGVLPIPVILLVLLVVAGLVRLMIHKAEIERTLMLARAEIIPELDAALASGRYIFPPRPEQ